MRSSHNHAVPDEKLVTECLSGSQEAWNEFYRRYDGLIRVIARRYGSTFPGYSDDDVVQTIYLKLVKSMHTYDAGKLPLKAFVGMAAKRVCIDHVRQSLSSCRSAPTSPVDHHGEGEEGTINPRCRMERADARLEKAQLVSIVALALKRLKSACRELIRLRFHMDLPYAKIAATLRQKEHTVNVRTLRCLAELKAHYDEIVREGLGP
ncbi:MAG: sigma-70 family RNA polymerase sigma factor [Desulfomonilaceae bacterium]|nr:sigma-70 family RNA polymerase sigma factor [Desulfomonilaceae bacterium]